MKMKNWKVQDVDPGAQASVNITNPQAFNIVSVSGDVVATVRLSAVATYAGRDAKILADAIADMLNDWP